MSFISSVILVVSIFSVSVLQMGKLRLRAGLSNLLKAADIFSCGAFELSQSIPRICTVNQ